MPESGPQFQPQHIFCAVLSAGLPVEYDEEGNDPGHDVSDVHGSDEENIGHGYIAGGACKIVSLGDDLFKAQMFDRRQHGLDMAMVPGTNYLEAFFDGHEFVALENAADRFDLQH